MTSVEPTTEKPLFADASASGGKGFFISGNSALGENFDSAEGAPRRVSAVEANAYRGKCRFSRENALDDYDFANCMIQ